MRKSHFALSVSMLFLLLFSSNAVFSQSPWSFNFSSGGAFSRATVFAGGERKSLEVPAEYMWSMGMGYRLTDLVSVHMAFDYAHLSPEMTVGSVRGAIYRLKYWYIPLFARFSFRNETVTPFLDAGPELSLKMDEWKEWGPGTHPTEIREEFSSESVSMMVGGGISFPLWSHGSLNLEGRYYFPFSNPDAGGTGKLSRAVLLLGVQIGR